MSVCTNCGIDAADVYCAKCGERQPHHHDLTVGHFTHDVVHELVHLDSKLFKTLRDLILRPGFLTAEYFAGRKSRYIAPLRLFLTFFALQFFAYSVYKQVAVYRIDALTQMDRSGRLERVIEQIAAKKHMSVHALEESINEKWHHTISLLQLLNVAGLALVLKILFRRRYYGEHLVYSAHYFSFQYLVTIVFWPIYFFIGMRMGPLQYLMSLLTLIAWFWWMFQGQRRFYDATGFGAAVKSAVAFAGGYLINFGIMMAAFAWSFWRVLAAH
ncbi:MAG: DUF3667 domain-containing protein [Acidobacteriota bacterium]|nr:DUF3667 domain-containing protein [Acidobacteriota bacterium]